MLVGTAYLGCEPLAAAQGSDEAVDGQSRGKERVPAALHQLHHHLRAQKPQRRTKRIIDEGPEDPTKDWKEH
jgi:hypothetical protein